MKKRILSFIVALSMLLPIFNVTAFSAEDIKSDKEYMEQYIRNLTDGGDYMKYTNYPFDEYNAQIEEEVYGENLDELAKWSVIKNFDFDTFGQILDAAIGKDPTSKENYELIFSELLMHVTETEEVKENKLVKDAFSILYDDGLLFDAADAFAYHTETKKIYEEICDDTKFMREILSEYNDSNAEGCFKYISDSLATELYKYNENAKYLDILKDIVYKAAESENDFARYTAMTTAIDNVILKYHNEVSSQANVLIDNITEQIKDGIKGGIKETLDTIFEGFSQKLKIGIFVKDVLFAATGAGEKIDSSVKVQFMYPFALCLQNEFYSQGRTYMKDDSLTDSEFEKMKLLFDLCRAAQEVNCEYVDVKFDKNDKTNEQIIQEYVDFAKRKMDIYENVNEIDGVFENHTYKVITSPMDYIEAKRYCESVGGHLAIINSKEERSYLGNILNSIDYREDKFLVECSKDVSSATHVLMQMGNFASDISSLIPVGKYKEYSEYKENDGYYFICEWDYYNKTEQFEKKLLRDKGQCGENAFWELTVHGEMTVYGSGPMYNSILTNEDFEKIELQGYSYTNVIESRYKDETKKIIVENGITSIGYAAFRRCDKLEEITLPDTLISIGVDSFNECKKLKQINIPEKLKYIGKGAFANCEQLVNVELSPTALKIGTGAFYRCLLLESIVVPNTVDYIGKSAFASCTNLKSATLSNSITNIYEDLFSGCINLCYANIPFGVITIGRYAFSGCEKLTTIKIPDTVKKIDSGVFNCTNVNILVIPKNVESIGDSAFDSCPLEELYILNPNCTIGTPGFFHEWLGGDPIITKVYGYDLSTAQQWVNARKTASGFRNEQCMYEFYPITDTTVIPFVSDEDITQNLPTNQQIQNNFENQITESTYLKSQEYLKALQIGTDAAMEEYIYNYGSGDMNPNIKTYSNTDEYLLDIYSDETFNLNFKTAYLNENSTMQTYKNKNHYILILPDNAQDLNEGYHYLVEGDGTGFKYNTLPVGNYTAYVRSDLCNEVGGDLALFKITVHDLAMDNIDEELAIAINFLKENGAMTGYEDGSFRPNKSMTRAEFAAIICRFTNNDIEFTGENNAFDDVFDDYWGYDYVMTAYHEGLLKGYGGGVFGCDDTLTEEQAITVLCRMLGDTYEDVEYIETNADEKGGYSEGYISIAGERGIDIEGLQKTVPATRARVAKWLYQLYNIKNNF